MAAGAQDPKRMAALNSGSEESRTLAEGLAIDQKTLALTVLPALGVGKGVAAVGQAAESGKALGISRQMAAIGAALAEALAGHDDRDGVLAALGSHASDTVRSWAAFVVGRADGETPLGRRLDGVRRFAADAHFGVREWAWLAVRPHIAADIEEAVRHLTPWTADPDPNIRRFAVECTRPRGVWCSHIAALKADPSLAEPLLVPVRADRARYVQDSVANWLNDASKSRPDWVVALCEGWVQETGNPHTARIVGRALRTVRKAAAARAE